MTYEEFKRRFDVSREALCREILAANRDAIRIKKENTVVKNLAKIVEATLKISNRLGFQAMSMRTLSREAGLSMGGLYAYFAGKQEIMDMLRRQLESTVSRVFAQCLKDAMPPGVQLQTAIETHLHLSEAMRGWFYFAYMETKQMNRREREGAMAAELNTEKIFVDILKAGQQTADFCPRDPYLTAGVIKAVLQDWYLKRWKYARRNITVDQYAAFAVDWVETFVREPCSGADT